MRPCPNCGAKLETPLGCRACGVLFSPEPVPTPFEVFGLEPAFALDTADLARRLTRISRIVHPDYFGAAEAATRERAERASALVNESYALLADSAARADWLVVSQGGPRESEQRDMPKSFLLEVLEWNEALEAARDSTPGSRERAALEGLRAELSSRKGELLAVLTARLDPLPARGSPALSAARADLNALRYLDNMLAQIDALRLEQTSTS